MSLPSQAAVIVTFEQSGNDVIARWDGTLDPGYFWAEDTYLIDLLWAGGDGLFAMSPGGLDVWDAGHATLTSLHGAPTHHMGTAGGFSSSTFVYRGLVNGLADSGVLTFDGATDYFTFAGVGLIDIGASGFSNTLAWTSSSGDTIKYTTVPEAGSALLGLVAMGLGSLIRKRRVV